MKLLHFLKRNASRIAKKAFETPKNHNLLNQKDKNTQKIEKGRSMLEMLGVLAVIGVLSVGGILGYKYGITKWKANETVNELNLRAHDIAFRMEKLIELNHTGEIEMEMGKITRLGYPIMARMSPQYIDYFEMFLSDVPSDVCKELLKSQWQAPYSIFVGVTEYEAALDICEQAEEVELAYEFYKDLTQKEEVPEESRHKIQRCKHENHCQCGTCNEDAGLCESFCVNSESCAKDYDDPRWMVCCDQDYVVNGYCCASITEDGKCCDRAGNCCPTDRPLKDKNGGCHACDEVNNIDVGTHDEYCAACPKRYTAGGTDGHNWCSLCGVKGTAVAEMPLIWDFKTTCFSCDYQDNGLFGQVNVKAAYLCENVCSNRELIKTVGTEGTYRCVFPCPADTPLRTGDNSCAKCDYAGSPYSAWQKPSCKDVCSDREDENGRCVLPACPKDKPLRDKYGACHACDDPNPIELSKPDTCSTICPKRYLNNAHHKKCIACGAEDPTVANKPLWDWTGKCYACDYAGAVDGGGEAAAQAATAARCSTACPNRVKNEKYCTLSTCTGNTPLLATDNKCYPCEDTTHSILNSALTDTCENLCSNRKTEGDYCVATCPPDKPLRDKYGKCHSCKEEGLIEMADTTSCSAVCLERYLSDSDNKWCILCGVEGTTAEKKPLIDKNGKCHSCDETGPLELLDPNTCSSLCPKRFLNNTHHKRCILCGAEGTEVANKPLWDWRGNCYSCEETSCVEGGSEAVAQAATAARCSTACLNRAKYGQYCCPACSDDKPLQTTDGCYDCNTTKAVSTSLFDADCSTLCPNRETKDGKCVRERCADGYFEGKDGTCYDCKITTSIAVTDEESCKVCFNRLYEDGMCIENTQ